MQGDGTILRGDMKGELTEQSLNLAENSPDGVEG